MDGARFFADGLQLAVCGCSVASSACLELEFARGLPSLFGEAWGLNDALSLVGTVDLGFGFRYRRWTEHEMEAMQFGWMCAKSERMV